MKETKTHRQVIPGTGAVAHHPAQPLVFPLLAVLALLSRQREDSREGVGPVQPVTAKGSC